MFTRKGIVIIAFLLFLPTLSANAAQDFVSIPIDADHWNVTHRGSYVFGGDGLQVNGSGYRSGNLLFSNYGYHFAGSELLVKWKAHGAGTYMGAGPSVVCFPRCADAYSSLTTGWSFGGSTVMPDDTWLYSRFLFPSDITGSIKTSVAINNYDNAGGTVLRTGSVSAYGGLDGIVQGSLGDNYGGTSAFIVLGEVKTTATVIPITPQVIYNFNDGVLPTTLGLPVSAIIENNTLLMNPDNSVQTLSINAANYNWISFNASTDDGGPAFQAMLVYDGVNVMGFDSSGWGNWVKVSIPIPTGTKSVQIVSHQGYRLWLDNLTLYADGQISDFSVTGISFSPISPTVGTPFSTKVTVRNQGTASGDAGKLVIWTDKNAIQACKATGNKSVAVGTLAAGASKTLTFTNLNVANAGAKTFRAFVDANCATAESDENNNQRTASYRIRAQQPDLLVSAIVLDPISPNANGFLTAVNQGTIAADAGYLDVWANNANYQSCGAEGDAWSYIGNLAVGASKTVQFSLPAGAAGSKWFRTFVDSWCEVTESNENNNQVTAGYTVN